MTDATFCLNFSSAACAFSRMASNISCFVATAFRCSWICLRNAADFLADIVSSSACSSAVLRLNHAEIDLLLQHLDCGMVEQAAASLLEEWKIQVCEAIFSYKVGNMRMCQLDSQLRILNVVVSSFWLWQEISQLSLSHSQHGGTHFLEDTFHSCFLLITNCKQRLQMAALWGKLMHGKTAGQFAWRTGVASCCHWCRAVCSLSTCR